MQTIKKKVILPCTVAQAYSLVNSIEDYPDFLPWCHSTEITTKTDELMIATINVAKGPIHKSFTSKNSLTLNQAIHMQLVAGPFKSFSGDWYFRPQLQETGAEFCEVEFELSFEFSNFLLGITASKLAPALINTVVEVFVERAKKLYG